LVFHCVKSLDIFYDIGRLFAGKVIKQNKGQKKGKL
jgi:hypothetical protein